MRDETVFVGRTDIRQSSVNNAFSGGELFWLREGRHQDDAQQNPEPLNEAAEVVADRGENGVVDVAVGEIFAACVMFVLDRSDQSR
jgi:hypothetical protein